MRLLVHASNIHGGGGLTLLRAALAGVPPDQPCLLIADTRLEKGGLPSHIAIRAFPPSVRGRFAAERCLQHAAGPDDVVLCLGNLPPLLKCRGRVRVYLGNRYLC